MAGVRGQQRAAKCGSRKSVTGFKPARFRSKCDDLSRLATAIRFPSIHNLLATAHRSQLYHHN